MFHVLGIDAGGTKTVCLLADDQGQIVAEARRSGANLQAVGELEVEKVLYDVMEEAIGDRAVVPAAICLGIAGVDRPDDYATVRGIMKRIGYKARVVVVNDALIALEAGVPGQPGIVVIAGTGTHAYGRTAKGDAARADVGPAVRVDLAVPADASSSGARRFASSAWRRLTRSTTGMCGCCSSSSPSGARLFPAV